NLLIFSLTQPVPSSTTVLKTSSIAQKYNDPLNIHKLKSTDSGSSKKRSAKAYLHYFYPYPNNIF
ncbi:MAG: hypothetical protein WBJ59_01985, partial [Dysgonamonadaceae bacterium]